jgi:ABC-type multidrug transport system fused ATPase/permease subunit
MDKQYSAVNTAWFLWKDGWRYSHKMMLLLVFESIVNAAVSLGNVILPSAVIALLTAGASVQSLIIDICILFGIFGILMFFSSYLTNRNQMQYVQWRTGFWDVFLKLSSESDYETYETDEVLKQIQKGNYGISNNNEGAEGYMHHLTLCISYVIELFIYLFMISTVNIGIVCITAALSLISYLLNQRAHRMYMKKRDELADNDVHVDYFTKLAYNKAAGKDIRMYQMQDMLRGLFEKVNIKSVQFEAECEKYKRNANLSGNVLSFLRDAVCYGYLIYQMMQGGMSIASFVLLLGAFSNFSQRFILISNSLSDMNLDLSLFKETRILFDMLQPKDGTETMKADRLDIVFDHVSFAYPSSDRKILDDFSLHIRPGEKLALVGVNGAGKTTIVKLLCRFYHPDQGRILVHGIDLEQMKQSEYMDLLSAVFQDSILFSFTVGENVSGQPEGKYDEQKVCMAIVKAGLKEKVDSFENGIHTYLGKDVDENGLSFSGGEVQKMLLARAWYHQGKFIILDEPTAALDAISEQELYSSYSNLIGGSGALFISHRLASTRFCDRIILIQDGKIAEEGTHRSLMNKKGLYYDMFEVQSKYYREGGENHELQRDPA